MSALIECIPNFSEGRHPEVIAAIVDAIRAAAPVHVLDTSSDPDHNRTVVTFIGQPDAVERAAFAAIRVAAQRIDMDAHRGEHPRLGATDVVPFVPIRDVTMAECVAVARRLGERVGKELNIPVYCYEEAATRPSRKNLEDIRRGEYEGLKTAIATDPERQPDFGPAVLGKAGATVIGARAALIAFNVYLTTDDVAVAKQIAKAIRFSSGGLRYVKSSGFLVEGRAQVSMNLTNYEQTPIHRVVELIRREAARYGVGIAFTELIGLTPQAALIDAGRWYLQLDRFEPDQLLERRVEKAPEPSGVAASGSIATADFVAQVAAGTPTPGGGAVAALAGALGAALVEMVARLTIGRKRYADVESEMQAIIESTEKLRADLQRGIDEDMAAYGAVMQAYKLDKTDPARETAIQKTLSEAAQAPLQVMRVALEALRLAQKAAASGNINAISDAAVAAHMALASVEGAALNVRINAKGIAEGAQADSLRKQADELVQAAHTLHANIIAQVNARSGL